MTTKIEQRALNYLLNQFSHSIYSFEAKATNETGFDLWLIEKNSKDKTKVELKATNSSYKRPSNLFERLIFNADIERELFEKGESVIARVFLGDNPHRLFIITNAILNNSAKLVPDSRYVLKGKINYDDSYIEIA